MSEQVMYMECSDCGRPIKVSKDTVWNSPFDFGGLDVVTCECGITNYVNYSALSKTEGISGEFPIEQWISLHVLVNSALCEPEMKSTPILDAYKSELLLISEKLEEIIEL